MRLNVVTTKLTEKQTIYGLIIHGCNNTWFHTTAALFFDANRHHVLLVFLYMFSTENKTTTALYGLDMLAEQLFTDQHDVTHPRSLWHNYNTFLHLRNWQGSNNKPPANYPWPRNCARGRDCTKNVSAFAICDATTIDANPPTTWTARSNENRYSNHCCKTSTIIREMIPINGNIWIDQAAQICLGTNGFGGGIASRSKGH